MDADAIVVTIIAVIAIIIIGLIKYFCRQRKEIIRESTFMIIVMIIIMLSAFVFLVWHITSIF